MSNLNIMTGDEVYSITKINVRREPYGEIIKIIEPETRLLITSGPVRKNRLVWWQVRNGVSGWVAQETENRAILIDRVDDTPFGRTMRFLLRHEGGYVDHPNDSGGATLWGIASNFHPNVDFNTLTIAQLKDFYRSKFWNPCDCDNLTSPLNIAVFDHAVNAGVQEALTLLEKSKDDFDKYINLRKSAYRKKSNFKLFGEGWLNRVDDLNNFVKGFGGQ